MSHYLKKAVECEDVLERLQWISAGLFAAFLYTFSYTQGKAPMSFYIGETY